MARGVDDGSDDARGGAIGRFSVGRAKPAHRYKASKALANVTLSFDGHGAAHVIVTVSSMTDVQHPALYTLLVCETPAGP